MRWDALFADLETQLAAAGHLALEAEVSERARMDQSGIELLDRLGGALDHELRVRLRGGLSFTGVLSHVGSEWMVLDAGPRSVLVPVRALLMVEGLPGTTAVPAGAVLRRLGLGSALRVLSRDRAEVVLHLEEPAGAATIGGSLERVGRNFLELSVLPGGERRRSGPGPVCTVPFEAILALTSLRH